MKILLTGANGQVGHELERSLQYLGEVIAPRREQLDLSNLDQLREVIRTVRPQLIVNPAAYTAVDLAEQEADLAYRINAEAPATIAAEARELGAALIHYSTDYVFDGSKDTPYVETDPTNPLNVYGRTKLAGEQAIAASGVRHLILRTSWVYGTRGKNFLSTIQRLGKEREELRIVADQHGAPTWSRTIADATALVLAQARTGTPDWWDRHGGIYHLTSLGHTTWHGFTEAIVAASGMNCRVTPIPASDYPVPAARPANSRLSCAKFTETFVGLPDWATALRLCLR